MVRPNFSKRSHPPRRPFDKDRLIDEMKLVGVFGLKNKRELWITQSDCDKIKLKARELLISSNEEHQIVSGRQLLNKLNKRGIIDSVDLRNKQDIIDALNSVLNLTESDFLKRRLQFRVFDLGIAKNVHQARCLIAQKQVCVSGRVVNKPGYEVGKDEDTYIELNINKGVAGTKKTRKNRKVKADPYEEEEE